jgi:hypothetical protein
MGQTVQDYTITLLSSHTGAEVQRGAAGGNACKPLITGGVAAGSVCVPISAVTEDSRACGGSPGCQVRAGSVWRMGGVTSAWGDGFQRLNCGTRSPSSTISLAAPRTVDRSASAIEPSCRMTRRAAGSQSSASRTRAASQNGVGDRLTRILRSTRPSNSCPDRNRPAVPLHRSRARPR